MIVIKTPEEIERMRAACHAAAEVLAGVAREVQPGRTTAELNAIAAGLIEKLGGKSPFLGYKGYPGHICVSVNEEVVHGIPSQRRVQYGDVVSLDVGIVLNGFVGDNATTVAVGVVESRTEQLLQVTERALYAGIAAARAGSRVSDISRAVQTLVETNGFSVVREFVGHGVGRKMHEEPQVPNYVSSGPDPKLKRGMTLAIEPMINAGSHEVVMLSDGWTVVSADGAPSAHFEHTVLITDGDAEILTWRKKSPYESKAS
ncbi:MAG TPA: type I methionyl aminopeptidase [Verrucomicrobiae bacterium]|nr:type I methionyl aminopeptidase [Verrucomicrobiae bacterium]